MRIQRQSIVERLFIFGFLLTSVGYYVALVLTVNVTDYSTTILSIVLRGISMIALLLAFLVGRISVVLRRPAVLLFLVISFMYLARLGVSYPESGFNTPWFLYASYLAYVFFPFVLLAGIAINVSAYDKLLFWTLASLGGFGSLCLIFYFDKIGGGRLYLPDDTTVLNPLILSYISVAGIGIVLYQFYIRRGSLLALATLLCVLVVPFALGASRGSVLSLIFSAVFVVVARAGKRNLRKTNGILIILLAFTILALFGDTFVVVINRMTSIYSAIESGASSASRLGLWRAALEQFSDSPVFGSSHVLKGTGAYPHNMFLEIAISTGILGVIAFSAFIFFVAKDSFFLLRHYPQYGWVAVTAVQQIIRYSFSHTFYTAGFLFVFSALVVSLAFQLKKIPLSVDRTFVRQPFGRPRIDP